MSKHRLDKITENICLKSSKWFACHSKAPRNTNFPPSNCNPLNLSVRTIPIISLECTPKGWRIALFLCIYRCVCVCDWLAEKHWKIVVFELPQNPFPKSSSSALTRNHSLRRWCCRCVTKNSDLIPMTSTMSGIPANLLQLSWRTSTQDCLRPQTTIAGRKTTTAAAFVSARKTTKRLMMRLRQLGTTNRRQQEHRMPRLATDDDSAIRQVPWDVPAMTRLIASVRWRNCGNFWWIAGFHEVAGSKMS